MTTTAEIRSRIVETLRRDLIGPWPQDIDLQRERLPERPSGWYVTGYLAPVPAPNEITEQELPEEGDPLFGDDLGGDADTSPARAADDTPQDEPPAVRIRAPSSLGLTVLLDASVKEVDVHLCWGDYVTVPPLSPEQLLDDSAHAPDVVWDRVPGRRSCKCRCQTKASAKRILVPEIGRFPTPFGSTFDRSPRAAV